MSEWNLYRINKSLEQTIFNSLKWHRLIQCCMHLYRVVWRSLFLDDPARKMHYYETYGFICSLSDVFVLSLPHSLSRSLCRDAQCSQTLCAQMHGYGFLCVTFVDSNFRKGLNVNPNGSWQCALKWFWTKRQGEKNKIPDKSSTGCVSYIYIHEEKRNSMTRCFLIK